MLELVRYIHLNPVRAKLVRRPEVLGQFGRRRDAAVRQYTSYIRAGRVQGYRPDLHTVVDQRFLGSDAFVAALRRASPDGGIPPPVDVPLDTIAEAVCGRLGLEGANLRARSKARAITSRQRGQALISLQFGGGHWTRWPSRESATHTHSGVTHL
jgi:putative transposase